MTDQTKDIIAYTILFVALLGSLWLVWTVASGGLV